jgi:hypothetical protein
MIFYESRKNHEKSASSLPAPLCKEVEVKTAVQAMMTVLTWRRRVGKLRRMAASGKARLRGVRTPNPERRLLSCKLAALVVLASIPVFLALG